MDYVLPVVMLVMGLIVGAGAAWAVFHVQIRHAEDAAKAEGESARVLLTERLAGKRLEVDRLLEETQSKDAKIAEAQAAQTRLLKRRAAGATGRTTYPGRIQLISTKETESLRMAQ